MNQRESRLTDEGPAHAETWSWDGRDWAGLQMTGQPGPDVKIVVAQGDNVAETIFGFEGVSRDFKALRINAWEWTGSAWRTISP